MLNFPAICDNKCLPWLQTNANVGLDKQMFKCQIFVYALVVPPISENNYN